MNKSNSDIQAQLFADDDIGNCEFIDITPNSNDIPNGFQAYIKHSSCFWCAYIKIPRNHPDFLSDESIENTINIYSPHGNEWTYDDLYNIKSNSYRLSISDSDSYVFGIDFAHLEISDWIPFCESTDDDKTYPINDMLSPNSYVYRDRDYATNEILRLLHIAIQRYNP